MSELIKSASIKSTLIKSARTRKSTHLVSRSSPNGNFFIEGKKLINLASWDIFCLKDNSQIKRAVHKAVEEDSYTRVSSRISAGTAPEIRECELRFAKLFGMDDGILFSSRNQAVFSLITNLFGEGDIIIHGDGVDAPIIDACVLCGATPLCFDYAKPETLLELLKKTKDVPNRAVFLEEFNPYLPYSFDLDLLLSTVSEFGVSVLFDESYSFSAISGFSLTKLNKKFLAVNFISIFNRLDAYLANLGCCVSTTYEAADKLLSSSRFLKKEVSFPLHCAMQNLASFEFLFSSADQKLKLIKDKELLAQKLKEFTLDYTENINTNFISLVFSKLEIANSVKAFLISKGFLVESFKSPIQKDYRATVPLLLNSRVTNNDLLELVGYFEAVKKLSI